MVWFESYNYVTSLYKRFEINNYFNTIRKGILIDTAPLYILIVGHYDKKNGTRFVSKFQSKSIDKKRTYGVHDYDYLLAFLNSLGLGKKVRLIVTPQIFTELLKHIWAELDSSEHFTRLLNDILGKKWYIDECSIECKTCWTDTLFQKREIEIGDVSILMLSQNHPGQINCVLTDDKNFAIKADQVRNLITIYYDDIRLGSVDLLSEGKIIPKSLLSEPTAQS